VHKWIIAAGAVVALTGAYWLGYTKGETSTALAYEQRFKELKDAHEKAIRETVAAAEQADADRRATADQELAALRSRAADADAQLVRMREQLAAYRRAPVSDAAACARDRDRLAGMAVRCGELLKRADSALEWCRIELDAAGAKHLAAGE
jgi:hypothetical protein